MFVRPASLIVAIATLSNSQPGVAAGTFSTPDVTPPVLDGIGVSGHPNMTQSNPSITVTLDISDDLTGVAGGEIFVISPDGGQELGQEFSESGSVRVVHKEQMGYLRAGNFSSLDEGDGYFTHWSQPGTWTVSKVILWDVAGNQVSYAGDQLAALGTTTFTVSNSKYDGVPPALVGGQILTPVISRSSGNDHGVPFVKTKVSMTDTGIGSASGVDYVAMYYCLPPVDADHVCRDYLSTYASLGVPGSGIDTSVTTSNVAWSWPGGGSLATSGVYQLAVVVFATLDGVSNASWSSPLVGGTTDFGTLFPGGTTVTINP